MEEEAVWKRRRRIVWDFVDEHLGWPRATGGDEAVGEVDAQRHRQPPQQPQQWGQSCCCCCWHHHLGHHGHGHADDNDEAIDEADEDCWDCWDYYDGMRRRRRLEVDRHSKVLKAKVKKLRKMPI
jgi:hypothetical protein